jgi:hypothetical protein
MDPPILLQDLPDLLVRLTLIPATPATPVVAHPILIRTIMVIMIVTMTTSGKNPSYVAVPMNYLGYIALGFTYVALHSLGSSGSNSGTLCRPGSFR